MMRAVSKKSPSKLGDEKISGAGEGCPFCAPTLSAGSGFFLCDACMTARRYVKAQQDGGSANLQ
jgi:hypothetical protein